MNAKTRTGYTHGWKSAFPQFQRNAWRMRDLCMASCDSAADFRAAIDAGFRGFYVLPKTDTAPQIAGAMNCPASKEHEQKTGRRTTCAACGACSGAGGKGARMPSVFIIDHGVTGIKQNACPAAARMLENMGV
jgi:hypothetical protein